MKLLSLFGLVALASAAFAGAVELSDHRYALSDINDKGLSKEKLYDSMNLSLVRTWDSICSNRAQVWAWDFSKSQQIRTAKIFLFYTHENGGRWWYHAANVVNEGGELFVLDPGFPGMFKGARTLKGWFKEFTETTECREIRKSEKDLVRLIFNEEKFPVKTPYGKHPCYFHLAPEGYWTPGQLAKGLLQEDESGRSQSFSRTNLIEGEVYEACMEVTTSPMGWAWGSGARRCNYFLANGSN